MEFVYHETENDVLILRADGGLNSDTALQFISELENLVDAGLRKIIVDCSQLTYVSSYGLTILLRLHRKMAKHGGDVKLAGVPGLVAGVLRVTHIDRLLSIYPDIDRARLQFRPKDA